MKTSDQINELALALSKAQTDFKDIKKNQTAVVKGQTKTGKDYEYSYDYADLSDILKAVTPALSKNGLILTQGFDQNTIITRLIHASGQWIETYYPIIPKGGDMQGMGAGYTFARRYAINGLLGISSEEDTDGDSARPHEDKPAPNKFKTQEPKKEIKNHALDAKIGSRATKMIDSIVSKGMWSKETLSAYIASVYKTKPEELTETQAKELYSLTEKYSFEELTYMNQQEPDNEQRPQ